MDGQDRDQVARLLSRVYLILCIAYMAWAVWHLMVPDHKKTEWRLRLLRSSALVMSRLARRTGAASLHREAVTGQQAYDVPYRLSLARVALERAYDRARNVST
jgi:hypothetical protein